MVESWDLFLDLLPQYGIKIAAAVLCGVLIGVERERKDKPAGLRTIVLITVGATLYTFVSDIIALVTEGPEGLTRVDTSRVAAEVVSGIGFIGAGTIIQARGAIHGLTTAATIWVSAGIGLIIGVGFPLIGIGVTTVVLLVLVALDPISDWLSRRGETREIDLVVPDDVLALRRIEGLLREHDLIDEKDRLGHHEDGRLRLRLRYIDNGSSASRMLDAIAQIDGVEGVAASSADER